MVGISIDRGKRFWIAFLSSLVLLMSGLVFYSPELYSIFCDVTGYGGGTQKVERVVSGTDVVKADGDGAMLPEVTVYFDANIDKRLAWDFKPVDRYVKVRVGETKEIFYEAHNNSDESIVGQATFNVTPFKLGAYFFKSECFCFSEQTLEPGQRAMMPVVFYLEEDMLKDEETKDLREVTLSYTFYRLRDLEEGGHNNHGGHGDHDGGVRNLKETGEERMEMNEKGEDMKFSPAGVRKS